MTQTPEPPAPDYAQIRAALVAAINSALANPGDQVHWQPNPERVKTLIEALVIIDGAG